MTLPVALGDRVDAIAIGASAGGIDALSLLLPRLDASLPISVFVVLHLPRERPSLLVELFAPKCRLAVKEAEDKEPVSPGTIYFAPPDYHVLLDSGPELALSTDAAVNYSRPSIDVLLESCAEIYGARLLAILLSGASDDGARGLAAVRQAGGLTIVQDPSESVAPTMVEAALELTDVDAVLSLEALGERLESLRGDAAARPARTP